MRSGTVACDLPTRDSVHALLLLERKEGELMISETMVEHARDELAHRWHMMLLRGILLIAFGIYALVQPGTSLVILTALYGVYAIVDGIVAFVAAARARKIAKALDTSQDTFWLLLFEGIVGVAAGVIAFIMPGAVAFAFLILIAVRALVVGGLQLAAAFRKNTDEPRWLAGISGVASIAFGILLFAWPGPGIVALVWYVGIYATIVGALLIASAIATRQWMRDVHAGWEPHPKAS